MEDAKPQVPSEVLPSNNGSDEIASSSSNGVIKRIHLPEDEKVEKEKFLELWHDQNRYIDQLETKLKVSYLNITHLHCMLIINTSMVPIL